MHYKKVRNRTIFFSGIAFLLALPFIINAVYKSSLPDVTYLVAEKMQIKDANNSQLVAQTDADEFRTKAQALRDEAAKIRQQTKDNDRSEWLKARTSGLTDIGDPPTQVINETVDLTALDDAEELVYKFKRKHPGVEVNVTVNIDKGAAAKNAPKYVAPAAVYSVDDDPEIKAMKARTLELRRQYIRAKALNGESMDI